MGNTCVDKLETLQLNYNQEMLQNSKLDSSDQFFYKDCQNKNIELSTQSSFENLSNLTISVEPNEIGFVNNYLAIPSTPELMNFLVLSKTPRSLKVASKDVVSFSEQNDKISVVFPDELKFVGEKCEKDRLRGYIFFPENELDRNRPFLKR